MRVFVVSDVHVEHQKNLEWVESICSSSHQNDVLICPGDISDNMELVERTLVAFKAKFADVFYTPGNHELWIMKPDRDQGIKGSVEKWRAIADMCQRIGVHTTPKCVPAGEGAVWIVPILSWHHESWDTEPDVTEYDIPSVRLVCRDYMLCHWPQGLDPQADDVARYFDALNDEEMQRASVDYETIRASGHPIISFSHFLPRIELIPEKRYLFYPHLAKMVGSCALRDRVQRLGPTIHVFGHTHFGWDMTLDGIRYIQAALGTPKERDTRGRSLAVGDFPQKPCLIYDTASGPEVHADPPDWQKHYARHPRDPEDVDLKPWVLTRGWTKKANAVPASGVLKR